MTYTVDYFISKFDAIPAEKWNVGWFSDKLEGSEKKCALGHCGSNGTNLTPESKALGRIWGYKTAFINDGAVTYAELGDTPKERILNALLLVKCNLWKEAVG